MPNHIAQIFGFTVTTDHGKTHGPFGLADTSHMHRFPMEFTAPTLHFDAGETSAPNTGAVELEVYGATHGERE